MLKNKRDWTSWLRKTRGIMRRATSMAMAVVGSSPPLVESTPRTSLKHPREFPRAFATNTKEPLRATELTAPSGSGAPAITRLSNRAHKEAPCDEAYAACFESPKGAFGFLASATTAPGLLKCPLNAPYAREADVTRVPGLGLGM